MNSKDLPQQGEGAALDPTQVHLLPYLLNRLTARINQLWLAQIRDHGLTVQRWQVLSILRPFDGARIGQIAEMSGNEQPVVSRVIDQMERDGLVQRRRAREDSRAVEVWLTDAGRALFDRLSPLATAYVTRLLGGVDEGEVKRAMGLLWKLLDDLSEA